MPTIARSKSPWNWFDAVRVAEGDITKSIGGTTKVTTVGVQASQTTRTQLAVVRNNSAETRGVRQRVGVWCMILDGSTMAESNETDVMIYSTVQSKRLPYRTGWCFVGNNRVAAGTLTKRLLGGCCQADDHYPHADISHGRDWV